MAQYVLTPFTFQNANISLRLRCQCVCFVRTAVAEFSYHHGNSMEECLLQMNQIMDKGAFL
jgi:hypothetical protein